MKFFLIIPPKKEGLLLKNNGGSNCECIEHFLGKSVWKAWFYNLSIIEKIKDMM